jgi:hypothetical protein
MIAGGGALTGLAVTGAAALGPPPLELPPDVLDGMRSEIGGRGYACPAVRTVFSMHVARFKVYCAGPPTGPELVYDFRIEGTAGGPVVTVRPWPQ